MATPGFRTRTLTDAATASTKPPDGSSAVFIYTRDWKRRVRGRFQRGDPRNPITAPEYAWSSEPDQAPHCIEGPDEVFTPRERSLSMRAVAPFTRPRCR